MVRQNCFERFLPIICAIENILLLNIFIFGLLGHMFFEIVADNAF